jgi:hypothetical protein
LTLLYGETPSNSASKFNLCLYMQGCSGDAAAAANTLFIELGTALHLQPITFKLKAP